MKKQKQCLLLAGILLAFCACRKDETLNTSTQTQVGESDIDAVIKGFYLLNEGNMGSNKSTLDYYDYTTGIYHKNIYAERNPSVVKELGDVGNDIKIYGSKLYAVINCSNKIEVMNVNSTKRIGKIEIPNCRYITFHKGRAYVSSYAGPVELSPDAEIGFVAEVDTTTLKVLRKVTVGYQPEEMAIVGDKLYVANSGGYRFPNYDRTVSVVDLNTFTELKKIDVAVNMHRLKADDYGDLYVSSRGDYYNKPSNLFIIDTKTDEVRDTLNIAAGNFCISNDMIYVYSVEWNWNTQNNTITYAKVDVKTKKVVSRQLITDGTDKEIRIPYGLAVDSGSGDFYITDARDYVSPGTLYCFSSDGKKKWSVTTGDIPAHFAFVTK